jgi:hypothetical protein
LNFLRFIYQFIYQPYNSLLQNSSYLNDEEAFAFHKLKHILASVRMYFLSWAQNVNILLILPEVI